MGGKLWHRVPDETGKPRLKEADITALEIDRPTVIYISGFLTTNKQYGYISGGIKRTQELLSNADLDEQPDVYAWSHTSLANLFNLAAYDTFPNSYSSKAGYTLAEHIIMPQVAEGLSRNKNGKLEGTPRDPEDAAQRLRNITLFGYSAGTVVAQETFNASLKMMKGIGYDEKNARKILKEVAHLALGNVSRTSKETDRFTTVTMVASNDRLNRFKNFAWGTLGTMRRMMTTGYLKEKHTKKLSVRPLSSSYAFLSAAVRPDLFETVTGPDGQKEKKKFTPLYPESLGRRSYHEIPYLITTDPESSEFANIALHVLANAVRRTETPNPLKLIKADVQNPIIAGDANAYNDRIENAMRPTPNCLLQRAEM